MTPVFHSVRRLGRWGWAIAVAIAVVPLSILAYQAALRQTGNFHTVVEGQLYRSAQPDRGQLMSYVRRHGIRTVVNLRGAQPGVDWYDEERSAAGRRASKLSISGCRQPRFCHPSGWLTWWRFCVRCRSPS